MNVSLIQNDLNVEFYFHPIEVHKSEDDIKTLYYNNPGTIVAIITKSNILKIFDCLGKTVLFAITTFKEGELIINYISWSIDSDVIFITYEHKKTSLTGIKKIVLNFNAPEDYYTFAGQDVIFNNIKIREGTLYSLVEPDDILFISGNYPMMYNLSTREIFQFFSDMENLPNQPKNYNFLIKETADSNSYFLFVKELYLILLLKENNENNLIKSNFLIEHSYEKNLTEEQNELLQWSHSKLTSKLVILDFFAMNTNGEIFSVGLNKNKNLILINSTDRVLRLFRYDFDTITLQKEHIDSVNKRKWINAHFYTFKIKSSIQDLIVSALADSNSLEFIFIDIETGNFVKRLEPFKYQCSDFICHYTNHFTILLVSFKKIYNIVGYLINNWGAFAPQLKYIEENIEFIEDEAFFDNFNNYLKKKQIMKVSNSKASIKKIFTTKNENKHNLFFKYAPVEEDNLTLQCEKDLQELFSQFNEIIDINKI